MELKLFVLALERLSDQVEQLKNDVLNLKKENEQFKINSLNPFVSVKEQTPQTIKDELLDAKQVSQMLGVCYNTIKRMIKKGILPRIKINDRRFKFEKSAILAYLERQKSKPIQPQFYNIEP